MKKPILFIGTLIVILFGLLLVRIYVSNQVATSGVVLDQVQADVDSYKMQNIILAEKLYSESSLTNIAIEASKEGFVDQNSDYILNGQVPVAYKQ